LPKKDQLKIAFLPTSIASTNFSEIAKILRAEGNSVDIILFEETIYTQDFQQVFWTKTAPLIWKEILRFRFIITLIFKYDIYHYVFGTTLANPVYPVNRKNKIHFWVRIFLYWYLYALQFIELFIIKSLRKKKIYVHFVGDDARLHQILTKHNPLLLENVIDNYYSKSTDKAKKRAIKRFRKFANQIFAVNPDLLLSLPSSARYIPYANTSLIIPSRKQERSSGPFKILHAPTDPSLKGTRIIVAAIERLREGGFEIDFTLLGNVSRGELFEEMVHSDLVIDQLLIGWYGGISVEAMSMGLPVVCYLSDLGQGKSGVPHLKNIPIINANKTTLHEILANVIQNRNLLDNISRRSIEYVKEWHNPEKISKILLDFYQK